MHRINKVKDARRRARQHQAKVAQKTSMALGTRFVQDKRHKPAKHKKRKDDDL